MSLVGKTKHDDVIQLTTYFAKGSQCGSAVDFGSHVDHDMFTGCKWSSNAASFHDFAIGSQVYGAVGDIENGTFGTGARFQKYFGCPVGETGVADDAVRVAQLLAGAAAGDQFEIGFEAFTVLPENVIEVSDAMGVLLAFDCAGISFVVEIGFAPPKCDKFSVVENGVAGIQLGNLFHQNAVWQDMAGHKQVVGGV